MNRSLCRLSFPWTLSLFLVLGWVGLTGSWAAPPEGEGGGPGTEGIALTEDQMRALADLQQRFRRELRESNTRLMAKRLELRTLSREEFTGPRGSELQAEIKALFLARRQRTLYYQEEALKILREDQRLRLPAGSDLGFRCSPGFGGGGPGRRGRRHRPDPAGPDEKSSPNP